MLCPASWADGRVSSYLARGGRDGIAVPAVGAVAISLGCWARESTSGMGGRVNPSL